MDDSNSVSLGPTPQCVRNRPWLALLRTGALSPGEAAAVHEHISSCLWCQGELAAYDALDAAVRQHLADAAFAPLTMEDIIYATETLPDANVASTPETSGKVRPALRHRPRPRLAMLGPLAAAVAVVLLASMIFAAHRSGPSVSLSGTPMPPSLTPTPPSPMPTANLAHSNWTLTRLIVDGSEQLPVPGHAPTLLFDPAGGQYHGIGGTGGCNGYGGTYTLAGTTFHVDSLSYTQMFCGGQVDLVENAYFQALLRVERYHLDGNVLTLTSADGSVQLTFRANG